jgi:hypothetical protein
MTRAFTAVATNAAKVESYTVRGIARGDEVIYTRASPPAEQADDPVIHSEMIDLLASTLRLAPLVGRIERRAFWQCR